MEVVWFEGLQTVLLGVHFEDVGHEHSEGVNVAGVGGFLFLGAIVSGWYRSTFWWVRSSWSVILLFSRLDWEKTIPPSFHLPCLVTNILWGAIPRCMVLTSLWKKVRACMISVRCILNSSSELYACERRFWESRCESGHSKFSVTKAMHFSSS